MNDKKTLNFTEGYEALERLVSEFESKDLDLEKDLPKFEKGMELAKNLQKRLLQIENTVNEITSKFKTDE